jgi:uncharacterized protein YndB with AHSA1/START domain
MHDILHDFPVFAPIANVYDAVSTPAGLDQWWTSRSSGRPLEGTMFELDFGPNHHWQAVVTRADPPTVFELKFEDAMADWLGTHVRFELSDAAGKQTGVRFSHTGWAEVTEHYRISCFCWAMYLRLMKRAVEHGEFVPYEKRLDV